MSKETQDWLETHLRIGYVDEFGPAWWNPSRDEPLAHGSHFRGPVPVSEAEKILDVPLVSASLTGWYKDGRRKVAVADPTRQLIVNKNNGDVLGVFKQGYRIHDYKPWTLDVLGAVTDTSSGDLGIRSVGLLRNSAVAFVQIVLPDSCSVQGFDFVPFLLAATSCDGTLATTYATGMVSAVCDNTMAMAISAALSKLKERHSKASLGKLGDVRDKLGLFIADAGDAFAADVERLCAVDVSDQDYRAWVDEVVPLPAPQVTKSGGPGRSFTIAENYRAELGRLWTKDDKVAPWNGTAFGILQLDNTFRTWARTVQAATGGRLERNYLNMATGKVESADRDALAILGRIQGRDDLVLAG